ncbi:matrix protein [Riverside virus 1]|uniref:Matrix protein n=1 Tax=Riverside virus 1 TaxID=1803263 RepID=A0A140D058_9RHAB|nr:matrix protein [Riverside virus 1]AMJ52361.1 matrix protein [Riverside virus 1]AMJ52366.1 matrix protein [Riverside virus 1]AMJ52371.1 matrix protein [Riverside virus 1]QTT60759.1 matrix protein [Riverside virus 1]
MSIIKIVRVDALLEMRFREPPRTYKDLLSSLEIIKDDYKGYVNDKEYILLFYTLAGFTCKYRHQVGAFYHYRGTINGVFKIKMCSMSPIFPLTYDYDGEGIGLIPNLLVSFHLTSEESNMSPTSIVDYIRSRSPNKYRKRHALKLSIFKPYAITVESEKDCLSIKKN